MTSLLNRLFGRRKQGSGATAKNRLHFVLQHDRINLPPERMDEMKREILAVIVKYLVVDEERVEIALEQRDRTHSKLVAEIPFAAGQKPAAVAAGTDKNGADAEKHETTDDPVDDTEVDASETKAEKDEDEANGKSLDQDKR